MTKRVSDMTDDEVRDLCGSGDYPEYAAKDAASRVAEAVRLLNYLTLPGDGAPGLTYPADVYEVVGGLKTAMERWPQLAGQLSGWLEDECDAGRVGHVSGGDPIQAALNATGWLSDVNGAAREMANALGQAQIALSPLQAAGE